ncbi:sugar transporter, putative [Ixodes scapularis]|uniref:Sugar transporter, putative n=1 Tax=Ixodes scapularis TaxID=6945 RepID=B7PYF8_IXOSC|nr:sugar transporter, putative [Ixodes scapularis]|eukprot:XP_002403055.1 sugar transporter, putative [Ixodes scapularis]
MVVTIGNLIVFVLGKWLDYKWLAFCCLTPSLIMAATLPWCKESPRWLLQKGRRKAATEALQFYVGTGIEKELETLEASISDVEAFFLRDLTVPHIYKPFLCTLLPMFMQQFSAICIILFFANDIFAATGTSMSPEDCTIIVGVIQVAVLLVATLLIDRLGRKVLLLFSTAVTSLSLMLPLRVKGFATGICTAFGFSCGFVVVKEYHDMQEFMGTDGTYWMFGAVIAACFFAVLFFVPETKGKSLEEIEHLFQKASSFEDTKRSNGAAVDRLRT